QGRRDARRRRRGGRRVRRRRRGARLRAPARQREPRRPAALRRPHPHVRDRHPALRPRRGARGPRHPVARQPPGQPRPRGVLTPRSTGRWPPTTVRTARPQTTPIRKAALMHRRTKVLVAVAAAGLVLAGCSGDTGNGGGDATAAGDDGVDLTEVTVTLNWVPYGEHAPFYHGVEQGIFADH